MPHVLPAVQLFFFCVLRETEPAQPSPAEAPFLPTLTVPLFSPLHERIALALPTMKRRRPNPKKKKKSGGGHPLQQAGTEPLPPPLQSGGGGGGGTEPSSATPYDKEAAAAAAASRQPLPCRLALQRRTALRLRLHGEALNIGCMGRCCLTTGRTTLASTAAGRCVGFWVFDLGSFDFEIFAVNRATVSYDSPPLSRF